MRGYRALPGVHPMPSTVIARPVAAPMPSEGTQHSTAPPASPQQAQGWAANPPWDVYGQAWDSQHQTPHCRASVQSPSEDAHLSARRAVHRSAVPHTPSPRCAILHTEYKQTKRRKSSSTHQLLLCRRCQIRLQRTVATLSCLDFTNAH